LAPIASAMAVELAVGLLHHPLGFGAPADGTGGPDAFGELPHCMRFFLRRWQPTLLQAPGFPQCTACGHSVRASWRLDRKSLIRGAMQDANHLESVSGLAELKAKADHALRADPAQQKASSSATKSPRGSSASQDDEDDWELL